MERCPPGGAPGNPGQAPGGTDLAAIAALLGVTEHELADALATGEVASAAELLGTTPEAMADKLGVSVADIQAFLSTQAASTPAPSRTP